MTPDPSSDPSRVVIYPSRAVMAFVLLGSVAFVLVGIWIGTSGASRGAPIWRVVLASYVGVPFFAACGIYAAYRLRTRRPAVVLDSAGITDTASATGAGHLSWDEVDRAVLYKYSGQAMLGIVPRDLGAFLSRQAVARRLLTKLNLALGCAPINVPQVGLSMELAELARLLQTRYGVRVEGASPAAARELGGSTRRPPAEIDGAKVVEWAWSDPEPFFVMPYSDRSGGIPIHGLAICRDEDSGAIYRFSCNRDWETENDSPQDSIEGARVAESAHYDAGAVPWQRWTDPDETR